MKSSMRHFISWCWLALPVQVFSQPLSGNYTLNSAQGTGGTNYQTFTDLAGDLTADGVSGNVVITVAPGSGPYNEQITIGSIPGSGPNATILLEGSGETLTTLTTSTDRHVLRLWNVQYFTINNLRIERNPASTGGFYGIHLFNSGNHITISNCSVDISGTNSTLYGAYIASGSMTSILDSGDFHSINILNDTAVGGGYGASVFGKASNLATDIVISGNTFYDFHSNGVYLRETNGTIVSNNYFDKRTPNITSCNAIQVAQAANVDAAIFGNYITVSQTANGTMTFRGIYLFNGTGHTVFNNVIADIHLTAGNFTGIEVRTGGTAPEIYFNTISLDNPSATTGNLFGISEELSNTNSILRNNVISISQPTSGTKAGLVIGAIASVTSAFTSDYNLLWIPNGNVGMKDASSPIFYPTLADWQAASTQDANSIAVDPQFSSLQNPIPTNPAADNLGAPIAWIPTDFLGNARGTTPDMGAYEFPFSIGIQSPDLISEASVYPNPFSDVFYLKDNSGTEEIVLYNALSGEKINCLVSLNGRVNPGVLSPGVYFYSIRGKEGTIRTGKIIRAAF